MLNRTINGHILLSGIDVERGSCDNWLLLLVYYGLAIVTNTDYGFTELTGPVIIREVQQGECIFTTQSKAIQTVFSIRKDMLRLLYSIVFIFMI